MIVTWCNIICMIWYNSYCVLIIFSVESQYDDPADVVEETYDEDEGIRKQKSTKGSKVKVVHQPDDDVYEDVEMGGASGSDDESNQVYASVSADHKAKKRLT